MSAVRWEQKNAQPGLRNTCNLVCHYEKRCDEDLICSYHPEERGIRFATLPASSSLPNPPEPVLEFLPQSLSP